MEMDGVDVLDGIDGWVVVNELLRVEGGGWSSLSR